MPFGVLTTIEFRSYASPPSIPHHDLGMGCDPLRSALWRERGVTLCPEITITIINPQYIYIYIYNIIYICSLCSTCWHPPQIMNKVCSCWITTIREMWLLWHLPVIVELAFANMSLLVFLQEEIWTDFWGIIVELAFANMSLLVFFARRNLDWLLGKWHVFPRQRKKITALSHLEPWHLCVVRLHLDLKRALLGNKHIKIQKSTLGKETKFSHLVLHHALTLELGGELVRVRCSWTCDWYCFYFSFFFFAGNFPPYAQWLGCMRSALPPPPWRSAVSRTSRPPSPPDEPGGSPGWASPPPRDAPGGCPRTGKKEEMHMEEDESISRMS